MKKHILFFQRGVMYKRQFESLRDMQYYLRKNIKSPCLYNYYYGKGFVARDKAANLLHFLAKRRKKKGLWI